MLFIALGFFCTQAVDSFLKCDIITAFNCSEAIFAVK